MVRRVVVDTNVLVSAILKGRNPLTILLFLAQPNDWEWMVTDEITSEYQEVINRPKFKLIPEELEKWPEELEKWHGVIRRSPVKVVPADIPDTTFPRDPKDAKFLRCAVSAQADYLITGDRDFEGWEVALSALPPDLQTPTQVIRVAAFVTQFISPEETLERMDS